MILPSKSGHPVKADTERVETWPGWRLRSGGPGTAARRLSNVTWYLPEESFVVRGEAQINGQRLSAGDAAVFQPGAAIEAVGVKASEILLFDLARGFKVEGSEREWRCVPSLPSTKNGASSDGNSCRTCTTVRACSRKCPSALAAS